MNRRSPQIFQWLIVFSYINYSTEIEYEFLVEDGVFYNECKDVPPSVLNMSGMFDMTNLNLTLIEEGLQYSGNMTNIWPGIQQSDRIQMAASIEYWDRGVWVPTILNMVVKDFCKVLFDKSQVWYTPWSSHIINREEIQEKCLQVPGTVFIFEDFTAHYLFGSGIPLRPTRYSIRVQFTAYDNFDVKRETEGCFEIRGTFLRIYK